MSPPGSRTVLQIVDYLEFSLQESIKPLQAFLSEAVRHTRKFLEDASPETIAILISSFLFAILVAVGYSWLFGVRRSRRVPSWSNWLISFVPVKILGTLDKMVGLTDLLVSKTFGVGLGLGLGGDGGQTSLLDGGLVDDDDEDVGDSGGKGKGKVIRRRRDLLGSGTLGLNGQGRHYPGLRNGGGNTCFLNSTLQSLASMSSLLEYLSEIEQDASNLDIPTELTTSLKSVIESLNTPRPSYTVLQTTQIARALVSSASSSSSSSSSAYNRSRRSLIFSAEQQDAQEFFVMLMECVGEEVEKMEETWKDIGRMNEGFGGWLKGFVGDDGLQASERSLKRLRPRPRSSPFKALMAHRISCLSCHYTEAVRHLPEEGLTINVPNTVACRLEQCLQEHTKLEVLDEFNCRRCSLVATQEKLQDQIDRMSGSKSVVSLLAKSSTDQINGHADPNSAHSNDLQLSTSNFPALTSSKKKRMREVQRSLNKVKAALEQDHVQRDLGQDVEEKLERSRRRATKQTMFARPPKALAIHLSRSTHYGRGLAMKNSCQILFPEWLDLSPFCTSGELDTRPDRPISTFLSKPNGPAVTDGQETRKGKIWYRLASLVVHYGTHSFGHYIAYRREPLRQRPTRGNLREGSRWYRISDEDVVPSSLESALAANPFLLFYERVEEGLVGDMDPVPEEDVEGLVGRWEKVRMGRGGSEDDAEKRDRARGPAEEALVDSKAETTDRRDQRPQQGLPMPRLVRSWSVASSAGRSRTPQPSLEQ